AGVEERALADAALAEEERQPRRQDVGDDELRVGVAPEEEERVGLVVALEPLVGRRRGRRGERGHPAVPSRSCPSAASSATTYSSSGTFSTSTPRCSQNSRSSYDGSSCTAHDLYLRACSPQMRWRMTRRFQSRMP